MEDLIMRRGDDYGAQAAFMRRAMETQLLIEEHINGIRDQPSLPRALLTLRAAIATGFNVNHEPSEGAALTSNAKTASPQGDVVTQEDATD